MVVSWWLPISLMAIAVFVLLGACWVAIRGLGGITALKSQVIVLSTALEACQERITREVKTRAGDASAAKREEERTILEQAQEKLTEASNVTQLAGRPKRTFRKG